MAGSLNKVTLVGRLGKDPELSYTPNGQARAKFSVATDEGYRDKSTGQKVERTEWHNIVAWRHSAEFAGNYLGKGRLVLIEGKLQTRKWQDQNTGQDRFMTEIVADNIQALDRTPEGQNGQQGNYQQQPQQQGNYQQGNYQQQNNSQQQGQQPQGGYQQQGGSQQHPAQAGAGGEDLGPAFPSEASGMDDVPF